MYYENSLYNGKNDNNININIISVKAYYNNLLIFILCITRRVYIVTTNNKIYF